MQLLLEFGNPWTYERLYGTQWEDVSKGKHPPTFEMWTAAQLPAPDEDTHGKLGACSIIEDQGDRSYLKEFFIHGLYADGTVLELGPMKRQVAAAYLQLHRLSINNKEWDSLKASGFRGIRVIGGSHPKSTCNIVKFSDGYWIKDSMSSYRVGPFTSKSIARSYALVNEIELVKKSPSDRAPEMERLEYPVFFFEYRMRNIPCADIVCAETLELAMKRFNFQWHVFDNTRPTVQNFTNIDQLQRSLRFLRITDISIIELNAFDLDYYIDEAKKIGNPSTNPSLMKYCRNPKFRYILGRDENTGRSTIKIVW